MHISILYACERKSKCALKLSYSGYLSKSLLILSGDGGPRPS